MAVDKSRLTPARVKAAIEILATLQELPEGTRESLGILLSPGQARLLKRSLAAFKKNPDATRPIASLLED